MSEELLIALAVGAIVFIAATWFGLLGLVQGARSQCPHCLKWWARRLIKREIIDQQKGYGLVTRTARTESRADVSGTSYAAGSLGPYVQHGGTVRGESTTSWQERVPIVKTTYRLIYGCKKCGEKWTGKEVKEEEDFG